MGNNFTTTTASGLTAGMTLFDARRWVRNNARNAGSATVYGDADVDNAIMHLGTRFLRKTRVLDALTTLTAAVVDAGALDVTALSTGATPLLSFEPRRMKSARIDGQAKPLELVEYDALLWLIKNDPTAGVPLKLAWKDANTAYLWPPPDVAYVVTLRWWQPFTLFQAGAQGVWASTTTYYAGDVVSRGGHAWFAKVKNLNATPAANATWTDLGTGVVVVDPTTLYLNIGKDILLEILPGAAAILQVNQPEYAATSSANWERYKTAEEEYTGEAGDGSNFAVSRAYVHGEDGE